MQLFAPNGSRRPDFIQRLSLGMMAFLVLLTFFASNMQAVLWQSSEWLVSTVLPAVVVDLTNEERADNSVSQLRRNTVLDAAARSKAQHMAANEYFSHFAPDGTTPWSFFQKQGYVYAHAGENLAIHFTDSSEVVEAWMLSPAHRKNIVDQKFTEIGVGTAKGTFDGYDTVYVVQLFGTPAVAAAVAPVVVSAPVPIAVSVPTPTPTPVTVSDDNVLALVEATLATVTADSDNEVSDEGDVIALEDVVVPEVLPAQNSVQAELPEVRPEIITTIQNDTVVVETQLATSSGLAVATVIDDNPVSERLSPAALVTRPNLVLQWLYGIVAALVVISLVYALFSEARRMHYLQVLYSIGLLLVMGGLLWLHTFLTSGAIVV